MPDLVGRQRSIAAVAGFALAIAAVAALVSIPRSSLEFAYQVPAGGNAFWPLPFAPLNGFTPEQLSSHLARLLFLLPACLLLGTAWGHPPGWRRAWPAFAPPIVAAALTAAIACGVLRGVPLQDDEATYLMQARLLTRGLTADPAYSPADRFPEPYTIFTAAGMSGMYLFGTPLVLAAGVSFGVPWLGQALLAALTVWASYAAAVRAGARHVAWMGSALLAVSPMLTFTSSGAVSQVPVLAGIALAVYGLQRGNWSGGTVAGFGLGLAVAARPQTAVPVGAALVLVYGRRDWRLLAALALGALPWLGAVAWYDQTLVGRWSDLPRAAYDGELERYGFGVVLRQYEHTPLKALALAGVVLVRLNGWALGWPLSLAGPAIWLALGRPHRAIVGPWAVAALATFAFQAGYASIGTSETGAIYHYTALPFITFATAAALDAAARRSWGPAFHASAIVALLVGTTSFYVEHALRLSRLATAIEGPRRSLTLPVATVLFEDVWPDRPQAGWVFGIPFRERSPAAAVVRFPRPPHHRQLEALQRRTGDRACRYLWFDTTTRTYQLADCREIAAIDAGRREAPSVDPPGSVRDDGTPWFEHGGWTAAFPYLPLGTLRR